MEDYTPSLLNQLAKKRWKMGRILLSHSLQVVDLDGAEIHLC